ncbi:MULTISPECIES: 2-phosphosulfolactate phosphatase family protein [unclassified Synechocystis]|uniref:2-phosphosulfolactate phosphatase family protein n=1 Tax=unclassified Synechocystis TaxID=2640012 RepID=UPI00041AC15B|nr:MULTISPECIES: 2-phosphosulfolactate phosphatase family protein [unclassified Synechocystis]AIE75770.1 2-phosphosulfolactate phosphatase [Synechocystis sp. PCC 6714]MCT0255294.1 2-phosphosulfolactate phosphatase family protein [Synechocystis sp. CS-94]
MEIFVYHTPELTPDQSLPDCAVVIDVLRATTTIATALKVGAEAVQVFSSLDDLMATSESWPGEKRLRAGERGGAAVAGYDLGNSPLDCTPELMAGKRLFLSTTNGTRALQRVQQCPQLITASLVNRGAAVNYLAQTQPKTVWLLGSGWEGGYSLEDTVCAGAIASLLQEKDIDFTVGNDELVAAQSLYRQWQSDLLGLFKQASHGQRLLKLDRLEDLRYCATEDLIDILPKQVSPGVLTAA